MAPAEGLEFWREMLAQQVMPVSVRTHHATDFAGSLRASSFGAIRTVLTENGSVDVERTQASIRRSDPDTYFMVLNLRGRQQMCQQRQRALLGPADMVLLHSSRAFSSDGDPGLPRQVGLGIMIDPQALPLRPEQLSRLLGVRLSGQDGVGKLVANYLDVLGGGRFSPADAQRLSAVTVDLIAVVLARQLDLEESLPRPARDNADYAMVRAFILARLGDPTLSPTMVAAAHHLSLRTLHRLFHANGSTVAGWIREQRLARCRRELLDPSSTYRAVHLIGRRWGFLEPSHFNRAFSAAYGQSPAAYREQHLSG